MSASAADPIDMVQAVSQVLERYRPEVVRYLAEIADATRPTPDYDTLTKYIFDSYRASAHRLAGALRARTRCASLDEIDAACACIARDAIISGGGFPV